MAKGAKKGIIPNAGSKGPFVAKNPGKIPVKAPKNATKGAIGGGMRGAKPSPV
jgi:hypothetical protein